MRTAHPSAPIEPVPRTFSIYLDLLRVLAATVVVLVHVKILEIGPTAVRRWLPGNGQEAVILFFVLSGYVIMASVDRKPSSLRGYALDRVARVYSVALPVLLLTAILSLTLSLLSGIDLLLALKKIGSETVLTLLGVAESWSLDSVPGTNQPLWSLCYEMMYYAIFGCMFFLRGARRFAWTAVLMAVAGPKVLVLFPCWLFGVLAYLWRDRITLRHPWILAAMPIVALAAMPVFHVSGLVERTVGLDYSTMAKSASWIKDTLVALLVTVHLFAVRQARFNLPEGVDAIIQAGAAATFTLYTIHFPVLSISYLMPSRFLQSAWAIPVSVAAVAAVTCVLAKYTENNRKRFRDALRSTAISIGFRPFPVQSRQ